MNFKLINLTMNHIIFKCIIWYVLIIGVWSIEEEFIKELKCLKKPPVPIKNLDVKWFTSIPVWYYYFTNKLEMYRTVADLTQTSISYLKEDDLISNACMFKIERTSTLYGFGDKKLEFPLERVDDGIYSFKNDFLQLRGLAYLTLTDNKSFIFFYACWEDDEASWGIVSNSKNLDETATKQIIKHAKSLGFDEKYFIKLKYDNCDNIDKLIKDEL